MSWGGLARGLGVAAATARALSALGSVRKLAVGTARTVAARVPCLLRDFWKGPGREHAKGQNPDCSAGPLPPAAPPPPTRLKEASISLGQAASHGSHLKAAEWIPDMSFKWLGPWATLLGILFFLSFFLSFF